jgi:hypothetical protein
MNPDFPEADVAVMNPENFTVLFAMAGVWVHTTCSITGTDVPRPRHEFAVSLVLVLVIVPVQGPRSSAWVGI